MKTFKLSFATILAACAIFTSLNLYAAQGEYAKNKHQEYEVNQQTLFKLINKYGDINITNWEKDKLSIDVQITVEHRNEDKARELLDYIMVTFAKEGNTIQAKTDFDKRFNKSGGFLDFGDDPKEFSINYNVKMPQYLNLELENKYGDVFINEITGRADIAVKYGNFKANRILRDNSKPLSRVYLAYSNGNIKEVNWLKLSLKYTPNNCEIEKAKALIAMTKYSKLYVKQASSIVCESKYDNYHLGTLENLVCEAKYTDLKVKQINKQLDLISQYGDIDIDYVPKDFETIKVNNKYGQVDIGVDDQASYQIDGAAAYANIKYPDNGKIRKTEKNTEMRISGTVGKLENPSSQVRITTKYGSVELE